MKIVDKVLSTIEDCLLNKSYKSIENEQIELKDSSTRNDWTEIKKSVCAFLNTEGGIIIVGIKEKINNCYKLTGFNPNNEENIKQLSESFTDDRSNKIDVSEYISTRTTDLLDKRVVIIYIDKLSEDTKYCLFEGKAYERRMTGDHPVLNQKILAHRDYKNELELARELLPVSSTSLSDLDIDKLNDYIYYLNKEIRIESIKSNIENAISFLERKNFIKDNVPTILGLLVCGKHPYDIIGGKCQVDCFVNSHIQVVQNKKIVKDTILTLMEKSVAFVFNNIKIGVSIEKGGQSTPEYPEQLIRECVNNALAHRDYRIDKYVNINITPNKNIEIRNPGNFKNSLLIEIDDDNYSLKRIIPNTKPKNPKLADILKVFNKWEGKGIGMSLLTYSALSNQIDLPYFRFYSENELALFIPSGKLLDENLEVLFDAYDRFLEERNNGNILSKEQKLVIAYLYKSEMENRKYRYTVLLTPDNEHLNIIADLEQKKIITIHPQSTRYNPVYVLIPKLFKTNFHQELLKLLGLQYNDLGTQYKEVLNLLYLHTYFSKQNYLSANAIGTKVWIRKGNSNKIKGYESFKRSVRNTVNKLFNKKMLVKDGDKTLYQINKKYKIPTTLFG